MDMVCRNLLSIRGKNIERVRSDEKRLSREPHSRRAKVQACHGRSDGRVHCLPWLPVHTHPTKARNWEGRLDSVEENVLYFHLNEHKGREQFCFTCEVSHFLGCQLNVLAEQLFSTMWLSTSNISTARKVAVCQRECPDQPLNKKNLLSTTLIICTIQERGVARSLQMCIYDAIFKQSGLEEQIHTNRQLIIHFKHLASAPSKISLCGKQTQPALKRGKAGCDSKMKSLISKPVMLAQKQKALGCFLSPVKEINVVFLDPSQKTLAILQHFEEINS